MSEITREEFSKLYKSKFLPILQSLEQERIEYNNKAQQYIAVLLVCLALLFGGGFVLLPLFSIFPILPIVLLVVAGYVAFYMSKEKAKIRTKFKKELVSKVISLFGNFYLSENQNVVTAQEIRQMGLFPQFTAKENDDIIVGIYKGCNFAINECKLTHTVSSGKSSHTVTDFGGLLIKIQMKKNFSGRTVVGLKDQINRKNGFEPVILEDIEFMKDKTVYSTDQIEARYILTTAFMERLKDLGENFTNERMSSVTIDNNSSYNNVADAVRNIKRETSFLGRVANSIISRATGVSAAFIEGYVYLFVPSFEDFFEINTDTTLFNEEKYYNIFKELRSILSIIDYLKLDSNLGL